jgi:medium-chain acyl-[acyl-carrier-protein] hydrolase
MNEPPFRSLEPLLANLHEALKGNLIAPFSFFGHSMGGIVAYEFTRYLQSLGFPLPLNLFVSGCRAPHSPPSRAAIYDLPDAEFLSELVRYNGIPKEVLQNQELMELMLPTLGADFRVCQAYVHRMEPLLECPITAFGGWADPEANQEQLASWKELTKASFSLSRFPGDHFFLNNSRVLLLQRIQEILAESSYGLHSPVARQG